MSNFFLSDLRFVMAAIRCLTDYTTRFRGFSHSNFGFNGTLFYKVSCSIFAAFASLWYLYIIDFGDFLTIRKMVKFHFL